MKFNFHKFKDIVTALAPIVLIAVPGGAAVAPFVAVITKAITEAEQIKGASGAEKKAHVLEIVKAGVETANATKKVKLNSEDVQAVASDGIDAVIGAVHVIEGAKVIKVPDVKP
jgi:hypothetical protein